MLPRLLKTPNRCADEIGSRFRNPQVFIKNKTLSFCRLRKFWKIAVRMLALPHFANPV